MTTDTRIEAFRQTVERLTAIPGALQTLGITLARAVELPGIIGTCRCSIDTARLTEEQTAIGSPIALRIRQSQLENELRQGWVVVGAQLQAATEAATAHVTTAAGGADAVKTFPFARRHLVELVRHRSLPTTANTAARLSFLRSAWFAVDAAMGSLDEIRFDARQRRWNPMSAPM